jgi:hypothetical protein
MLSLEDVVKNIQRNLKVKSRELKKLLKEYDQIGMSNNEEEDKMEEQNLLGEEIARIKEVIDQLGEKLEVATEGCTGMISCLVFRNLVMLS